MVARLWQPLGLLALIAVAFITTKLVGKGKGGSRRAAPGRAWELL